MVFSTFDPSASLFLEPARITEPLGWVGHIPFAFWITEAVKPAVFVELGTHTGNSYFSFCQSVAANRLPTSCYAVDTWEGDHHAGFYGNDVFVDVDSYNSKHYHGFSHLLRMTFNQALERFSDGSIDLLHIDGLHTYEAVRHDFENWLPKMSSRGIVLFHDINVCERDFGVWKFWEEVSARYPHIAFDHSHGLGVLLVGHEQNLIITAFVHEFQNKSSQDIIKSLFARTGRLAELEYRTGNLSRDVADRDLQINAHSLALAGRDEQINALSLTVGERDEQINALSLAVAEHDAQINSLTNTLEGRDVEIKKMITSNSWRITKPVRKIHNSLRKRLKLIHYFFYPIKRINKSKKIVFSDSDWYLKQYKNISTDISPSCFYINYGIANYQNKKKHDYIRINSNGVNNYSSIWQVIIHIKMHRFSINTTRFNNIRNNYC